MSLVVASGIGKRYLRLDTPISRLRYLVNPTAAGEDSQWALQPCDVQIERGESVGIVGRNGSGKSTLLSIIAGVVQPTTGSVHIQGRVSALLELGSGFTPEFTGRDNAYFSGLLHGFSQTEMHERIEAIAHFAEIGDFFDRPVRTYSSGMFVRLAFAVAISVEPDLLIVDEALSVGDVFFQQKCFERLRELRARGTSLVFVSHDSGAIYRFCDRAILLEGGKIVMQGEPKVVITAYESTVIQARDASHALPPVADILSGDATTLAVEGEINGAGEIADASEPDVAITEIDRSEEVTILDFGIFDHAGNPATAFVSEARVTVRATLLFHRDIADPHVGFKIRNRFGEVVFETNTYCMGHRIGAMRNGETLSAEFTMTAPLHAAEYTLNLGVAEEGYGESSFRRQIVYRNDLFPFKVLMNPDAILWSGVVNLMPELHISKGEGPEVPTSRIASAPLS